MIVLKYVYRTNTVQR